MSAEKWPETEFVERHVVVARVPHSQRDEPPGRGDVGYTEHVIAEKEIKLFAQDVKSAVRRVTALR
jgi:hypothetical protein